MKHKLVNVVEITQEEDFRIDKTVVDVIALFHGPGDMFFLLLSMLWGLPWQRLNTNLVAKRGWQSAMVKLLDHWDLHWRLWLVFTKVVEHCKRVGVQRCQQHLKIS